LAYSIIVDLALNLYMPLDHTQNRFPAAPAFRQRYSELHLSVQTFYKGFVN